MNRIAGMKNNESKIVLGRWKNTRFWAVWINQELLAVVLYKKGAVAIKKAILALQQRDPK
jgi:hypothetical protein